VSSLPCGTGTGDDEASGQSPAGAARAESDDDDDDDDMANVARRSEELDGNLMKNDSSGGKRCRGVGFEPIYCDLL
jgi:hypothetical protein